MQRGRIVFCATSLLLISGFASVASGQQINQPRAEGATAPVLPKQASRPSDQKSSITFKNGLLSVFIQNRALRRVTEEISSKAGIAITLSGSIDSQLVSANFQNLPLDAGLRQILNIYDAFYFYGVEEQESSSLKVVWVYPKGRGRGIVPVPPEDWASTKEIEGKLADKDPDVRRRAIETLVKRKREAALGAVLKSLNDSDDQVRSQALYGAVTAGVQVPEGVLDDLAVNDASPSVRFLALQGLSNSPDLRQIAERAANDPSEPVRIAAQQVLAQLDKEANPSPNPPSDSEPQLNQPPPDESQSNQPPQNQ
jgi:hypothetical protein